MQEIRRRKIAGLGLRIVAPKFVRVLALFLLACGVAAVAISYWHLKDRTEFRLRPGQAQLSTEVVGEITNLEHREMKGDKLWVVLTADHDLNPLFGRPLRRRLRNFRAEPDNYLASLGGPLPYMRRLREIEALVDAHLERLEEAYAERAADWHAVVERWDGQHHGEDVEPGEIPAGKDEQLKNNRQRAGDAGNRLR